MNPIGRHSISIDQRPFHMNELPQNWLTRDEVTKIVALTTITASVPPTDLRTLFRGRQVPHDRAVQATLTRAKNSGYEGDNPAVAKQYLQTLRQQMARACRQSSKLAQSESFNHFNEFLDPAEMLRLTPIEEVFQLLSYIVTAPENKCEILKNFILTKPPVISNTLSEASQLIRRQTAVQATHRGDGALVQFLIACGENPSALIETYSLPTEAVTVSPAQNMLPEFI